MTETFDMIVLGVAALILIPVLLSPAGWLFAAIVVALWLLVAYGLRFALGVEKARRQGERGRIAEVRSRAERRDE